MGGGAGIGTNIQSTANASLEVSLGFQKMRILALIAASARGLSLGAATHFWHNGRERKSQAAGERHSCREKLSQYIAGFWPPESLTLRFTECREEEDYMYVYIDLHAVVSNVIHYVLFPPP